MTEHLLEVTIALDLLGTHELESWLATMIGMLSRSKRILLLKHGEDEKCKRQVSKKKLRVD